MSKEFHNKAERYLQGKMSSSEAVEFESLLNENQDLKEEFSILSDMHNHFGGDTTSIEIPENEYTEKLRSALGNEDSAEIKNKLKKARLEYEKSKGSRTNYFRIAASIVFVLLFGSAIYFFMDSEKSNLYADFYDPSDLPSVISRSNDNSNVSKAIIEFQNKNYMKALELLDISTETTTNSDIPFLLYHGMASLETGNLDKALSKFNAVINSNSIDRSKGYWFKALAYLKVGEDESAQLVLREIVANPNYFNHKKARDLLDQLSD